MFDPLITAASIPGAVDTAHAYDLIHLLAEDYIISQYDFQGNLAPLKDSP
jgi:hypothetical protein